MSSMNDIWRFGECTDRGHVRSENEDNMGHAQFDCGQIYVVADGMGGHNGGRLASKLTVEGILDRLKHYLPERPIAEAIEEACKETNKEVYDQGNSGDPEIKGMGSTTVIAVVTGAKVVVGHVGDSRAYLYRAGKLQRLTKDHSLVQRMIDAGMLSPAEARNHPDSSVIYRAIGDKPSVEVEIGEILQVEEGDSLLLCSDGLCGYVDDAEIETTLRDAGSAQDKAERLVKLGLKAGGQDNITVQYLQYGEPVATKTRAGNWLSGLHRLLKPRRNH